MTPQQRTDAIHTVVALACFVALLWFFALYMGPTGDGPHEAQPDAVATDVCKGHCDDPGEQPGWVITATPPFVVYLAEVR